MDPRNGQAVAAALALIAIIPGWFLLTAQTAPHIAVVGASLIDGTGAEPIHDSTIVIENGRIAIAGSSASVLIPEGAIVIDAKGKWITPGLVDVHTDFFGADRIELRPDPLRSTRERIPDTLKRYICAGVTTVASLRGPLFAVEIRDFAQSNGLTPNVLLAYGPVSTLPTQVPLSVRDVPARIVADGEMAGNEVDFAPDANADLLWIDTGKDLAPEQSQIFWNKVVPALVAGNEGYSPPIVAYVEDIDSAKQFLRAGVTRLVFPYPNFPADDGLLDLARDRGAMILTTGSMVPGREMTDYSMLHPIEKRCSAGGGIESNPLPTMAASPGMDVSRQNMKAVFAAGIPIAVGSHSKGRSLLHGTVFHEELQRMAESGIPPRDLILAATRNGAGFLGRQDDLGTIEAGKIGDLLVLDENPLSDIRNLTSIHAVIKDGRVYDADMLK